MGSNNNKLILILTVLFFVLVGFYNFIPRGAQHFVILSESFLKGQINLTHLDNTYGKLDMAQFDDRYYWPEPFFPAVVITPFVFIFKILGLTFFQGYLQFFLSVLIFVLAFKIAQKFKQNKANSLFLAFGFCFASNFSFIAFSSESWYFSQTISVCLLILAFYEWFGLKRLWLIGIYIFCILLTRLTAIGAILFFVAATFLGKGGRKYKNLSRVMTLVIPLTLSILLNMAYNHARFGSIWETGHSFNDVAPIEQKNMRENYGLFRLENIPTNFYWYFLSAPEPVFEEDTYHLVFPYFRVNPWGLSFLIVSPLFLYSLKTINKKISRENIILWGSVALTIVFLLMWHSTGYVQIGPRYILDILPALFILLLSYLNSKLTSFQKMLIIATAASNLFWFLTF